MEMLWRKFIQASFSACVVVASALPFRAAASDIWSKYHNTHLGFQIDFPQQSLEETRVQSDSLHTVHLYQIVAGLDHDGLASVNSIDMAENGVPLSQYQLLSYQKKIFDNMTFPAAAHNNEVVSAQKSITIKGYPARDFITKTKDGRLTSHHLLILEGAHLVAILVGGPTQYGIPWEYDRMVRSIEFDRR